MSSIGLISENDNSTVLAEYTGLNRVATSFQSEDALEKELIKTLGKRPDFDEEWLEAISKSIRGMMEEAESMQEKVNDAFERMRDVYKEMQDRMDKVIDR